MADRTVRAICQQLNFLLKIYVPPGNKTSGSDKMIEQGQHKDRHLSIIYI